MIYFDFLKFEMGQSDFSQARGDIYSGLQFSYDFEAWWVCLTYTFLTANFDDNLNFTVMLVLKELAVRAAGKSYKSPTKLKREN